MRELGLTISRLALLGDLSTGTAYDILRGTRRPSVRVLKALERTGLDRERVLAAWARARERSRRRVLTEVRARNNMTGGFGNEGP